MTDNTERDAPKPVTTAFVRRHYSMGPTAYREDGSIAKDISWQTPGSNIL